ECWAASLFASLLPSLLNNCARVYLSRLYRPLTIAVSIRSIHSALRLLSHSIPFLSILFASHPIPSHCTRRVGAQPVAALRFYRSRSSQRPLSSVSPLPITSVS